MADVTDMGLAWWNRSANPCGVGRQVQARPEADFQNLAADRRKQLLPMLCHERPVHEKVAKSREDHVGVKAHSRPLILVLPLGCLRRNSTVHRTPFDSGCSSR